MSAKVCILTTAHPPFDTRIFHKQAKSLVKAGYDVTLIVRHDRAEAIDGVRILPLEKPANRLTRMLKTTWQVWQKAVKQKASVYHFHDPELIPVGLFLKLQGRKVIYDVHEDVPRQILSKHWIAKPLRKIIAWLVERVENFAAKRFDAVVTATPFIRERFRRLSSNVVDVNNFPILSELHLPNLNWSKKERAVCYVGGISRIRGIYKMIEAMAQTNVKLLLAGRFSSADERNRAVTMPGWDRVEELGQLNRDEVKGTLLRSKAGLSVLFPVPNYVISQPTKMLEYMSAGIPVIASDFPLWKEIIEGNQCGICVNPLNPGAIAQAIRWIVDNPDEAKRMGENGRRVVVEKYNWEQEAEKLLLLYEELLKL
ncbi:glycosyltransferase family 4 protein [Thermodesulfovibrionales bacterium]|nr:glycosyltransferase family 4 protein [Thermodesulfovibrionales bacterium]